jgi:Flp pilus assembly pilin Flp
MRRWRKIRDAILESIDSLILRLGTWVSATGGRLRSEAGQTVAEYALVLLVAAAIAVAFLVWAKQSGKLDSFFDLIFDKLVNSVDPQGSPAP